MLTVSDVHGSGWPCNVDTIDHCSQHEFCRKSTPNATAGVCCCMLNYEFLDGRCYAIGNATTVNIILDDAGELNCDIDCKKECVIYMNALTAVCTRRMGVPQSSVCVTVICMRKAAKVVRRCYVAEHFTLK